MSLGPVAEFLPPPKGPTLAITVIVIVVTSVRLLREIRIWLFPSASNHITVTVTSQDSVTCSNQTVWPTRYDDGDDGPKAEPRGLRGGPTPPLPQVGLSDRPPPVCRRQGTATCPHVFKLRAKNQHGFNFQCETCQEAWYQPWAIEEQAIAIKERVCRARVITEISL